MFFFRANRLAYLFAKAYNSIYFCLEGLGFRVEGPKP